MSEPSSGANAIEIFCDGACLGNPGPGGWAALLRWRNVEKVISGGEAATTNNRMELRAAIEALATLKRTAEVHVYTDSLYLRDGITRWIHAWKRNGWRRADKEPVKNADLWQTLDAAADAHRVHWHWVKGHSGHPENDRVDQLAREAATRARDGEGGPPP